VVSVPRRTSYYQGLAPVHMDRGVRGGEFGPGKTNGRICSAGCRHIGGVSAGHIAVLGRDGSECGKQQTMAASRRSRSCIGRDTNVLHSASSRYGPIRGGRIEGREALCQHAASRNKLDWTLQLTRPLGTEVNLNFTTDAQMRPQAHSLFLPP
jgi:hypothetical protein